MQLEAVKLQEPAEERMDWKSKSPSIPTNKPRCISPIISSVHRKRFLFSIRGGTKLLYVRMLAKEKDLSRIMYMGRPRYDPVRSAHYLLHTQQ